MSRQRSDKIVKMSGRPPVMHFTKDRLTKSKRSLILAFNRLVLQRSYLEIHVADIISEADVSRSTFYEHFRNKDDVLRHSLVHVLGPLANAGFDNGHPDDIKFVLQHFRDFQSFARIYLAAPVSHVLANLLREMVEAKLCALPLNPVGGLPVQLVAAQISGSTLGMIKAWLDNEVCVDSMLVAAQIHRAARALQMLDRS
jgi:AcrR family transcriptional regulator